MHLCRFRAGGQIQLMAESVNSKRQKFPVPFLTYFDNHRSLERRATIVYDTSIISVLTLFLFYGKDFKTKPSVRNIAFFWYFVISHTSSHTHNYIYI